MQFREIIVIKNSTGLRGIVRPPLHSWIPSGTTVYVLDGKMHRSDGPACIGADIEIWIQNGKYHRTDGPALIIGVYKYWYLNGNMHRYPDSTGEIGPALIVEDRQMWFRHGSLHRDGDMPAVITNNNKEWYKNGTRHRLNGPAIIKNGFKEYYINGKLLSRKEFVIARDKIYANQRKKAAKRKLRKLR